MSVPRKIPRIVTFDILRGFFLIAIIINHLALFPNLLDWWGMRGYLLVTTAEGFFLLSGIVLGVVRGAKLVDRPLRDVTKLVLQRAWTLYLTHIILVIGFTLIAWYVYNGNPYIKFGVMEGQSVLELIWKTVSLQYIYGWADYLRFYAIFIALSPIAFWLLRKGKWYVVLLASYLVWFLFPIDYKTLDWELVELLQPVPWQSLFFTGLVIGFHWPSISAWCEQHKRNLSVYAVPAVIVAAIVTLIWNVYAVFAQEFINTSWAHQMSYDAWSLRMNEFHKEQLPLQRFLLFMLWFWASFLIVKRFERPITRYTGWLLLPFGTNSLYVYTLHAIIIFFVHIYVQVGNKLMNFVVTVSVIALIYVAVRTKFLMNIIPR
jgi:hypothetical protein